MAQIPLLDFSPLPFSQGMSQSGEGLWPSRFRPTVRCTDNAPLTPTDFEESLPEGEFLDSPKTLFLAFCGSFHLPLLCPLFGASMLSPICEPLFPQSVTHRCSTFFPSP